MPARLLVDQYASDGDDLNKLLTLTMPTLTKEDYKMQSDILFAKVNPNCILYVPAGWAAIDKPFAELSQVVWFFYLICGCSYNTNKISAQTSDGLCVWRVDVVLVWLTVQVQVMLFL